MLSPHRDSGRKVSILLYRLRCFLNSEACFAHTMWLWLSTEGRIGFRTTFLPQEEELNEAIVEFKSHHELFCDKYA